jgi:hypothetical protein
MRKARQRTGKIPDMPDSDEIHSSSNPIQASQPVGPTKDVCITDLERAIAEIEEIDLAEILNMEGSW